MPLNFPHWIFFHCQCITHLKITSVYAITNPSSLQLVIFLFIFNFSPYRMYGSFKCFIVNSYQSQLVPASQLYWTYGKYSSLSKINGHWPSMTKVASASWITAWKDTKMYLMKKNTNKRLVWHIQKLMVLARNIRFVNSNLSRVQESKLIPASWPQNIIHFSYTPGTSNISRLSFIFISFNLA